VADHATDSTYSKLKRRRFRRPSAVTLVAWLFLLQFLLLLLSGSLFWPGGQVELNPFSATDEASTRLLLDVVFLLLALLALIVSIGLFRLKHWAWRLAMTMEGLNLASALTAYVVEHPEYLNMLVGIVIVMSLNQREVREAFERREARLG
jgi:hypothetical protein